MESVAGHPHGLPPVYRCHILPGMADLHERLARATGFEWDAGNAAKSWSKHQVTQPECEQVFFNAPLVLAADPDHSGAEARFFALGRTDAGRRLLVVFTLRGTLVRVISARPMSRREREVMLDELKMLANERDVPYQSLLKVFLAERLAAERARKRRAG